MTSKRFYSVVWRVNALLIFAVGVGCLLLLLFAATMFIKDMGRGRHAEDTVHVNEVQVAKAEASLGAFTAIEGSAMMRAPLTVRQEVGANPYVSKVSGTNAIQNYLYVDPVSHTSHWLITGNRGLILETTELLSRSYSGQESDAVEAVVYRLVDTDTDGDGKLSEDDLNTIAVSDPAGKRLVRLFAKVDYVNGLRLTGKGALVVLYTAGGHLHAADVDLNSNKVVRDSILKP